MFHVEHFLLSCKSMATLGHSAIAHLVQPYFQSASIPAELIPQLSLYLDLLMKWNARTNLTAIRQPDEIVRRHFGESLFAGLHLELDHKTLLDFGSGAGFPGLPIQLLRPELSVTLAESQGKKASFLREVVRSLGLRTEVWADRVEAMAEERRFDVVALRAVDRMDIAMEAARLRVHSGGTMLVLTTGSAGILVPESRTSRLQIISC